MSNNVVLLNLIAATAVLAVSLSARAEAQPASNYSIQRVVIDGVTPRPDGLGKFAVYGGINNIPVIDGDWIVFRSFTPNCTKSSTDTCVELWSVNFTNGAFVKLVDHNTPVPHGTGNFQIQGVACVFPQARGGGVMFQAQDSATVTGLYAVATAGGPVALIANTNTVAPTGGTFTSFGTGCGGTTTGWDIYGDKAVFLASTTLGGGSFVFSWLPKAGLAVVSNHVCLNDPEISGSGQIAYFSVDCFDSPFRGGYFLSTGLPLVYTGTSFQTNEFFGPSELSGTLLGTLFTIGQPGFPSYQAIGVTSTLTGGIPGSPGSYSPQFTVWTSNTPMSGIPASPVFVAQGTFTFNRGSAAFQTSVTNQNSCLYIVSGATPQLIICAGDILGGAPIYEFGQTEHSWTKATWSLLPIPTQASTSPSTSLPPRTARQTCHPRSARKGARTASIRTPSNTFST
jgi:hypothetical protein